VKEDGSFFTRATIAAGGNNGGSGRNPNGIQAISPGLERSDYPGKTNNKITTPTGLNHQIVGNGDATPWGLKIILTQYPG
jgi:hypothetical protein